MAQAIAIGRPWSAPKTAASTVLACLHGRQSQLKHLERVGKACHLQVEHTQAICFRRLDLDQRPRREHSPTMPPRATVVPQAPSSQSTARDIYRYIPRSFASRGARWLREVLLSLQASGHRSILPNMTAAQPCGLCHAKLFNEASSLQSPFLQPFIHLCFPRRNDALNQAPTLPTWFNTMTSTTVQDPP